MRFMPDGARVTAQTTTLIELLGNGVLSNIASIPVQDGKLLVGNAAGQYVPVDKSAVGIQDPSGSLGKLAAITLAANKILNTDGSGNLTQSDITAAALVLLKLAGTAAANKLPYFNAATSAALTDFTAAARALTNLSGTAAADRLPYLTSATGAGLTTLSAFARTILDDASGAAMWATMGAQISAVGSSGYCIFPNKLLVQWGSEVLPDGVQYGVFALPTSFVNNSYILVGICGDAQVNPGVSVGRNLDGLNPASFAYRKTYQSTGTTVAYRFNYIAVGVAP